MFDKQNRYEMRIQFVEIICIKINYYLLDVFEIFSTEYHFRLKECFIQLILYWNRLLMSRFVSLKLIIFSTLYFSFSSIIIDDNDEIICSKYESFEFFRSRKMWNTKWMFISSEKSSLKDALILFNILNDSSIL